VGEERGGGTYKDFGNYDFPWSTHVIVPELVDHVGEDPYEDYREEELEEAY